MRPSSVLSCFQSPFIGMAGVTAGAELEGVAAGVAAARAGAGVAVGDRVGVRTRGVATRGVRDSAGVW